MFYLNSFISIGSFLVIWTLGLQSIQKDFCHAQNSQLALHKAISNKATRVSTPSFYLFQSRNGCHGLITGNDNLITYRSLRYDSFKLETSLNDTF